VGVRRLAGWAACVTYLSRIGVRWHYCYLAKLGCSRHIDVLCWVVCRVVEEAVLMLGASVGYFTGVLMFT
jgi:hypothetical protein